MTNYRQEYDREELDKIVQELCAVYPGIADATKGQQKPQRKRTSTSVSQTMSPYQAPFLQD